MENIYKILKEHKLFLDVFNVILGVAVIVLIVLLFINPENSIFLFAALLAGGFMNIVNGLLHLPHKNKAMSLVLIVMGIIIIFLAFINL